MIAGSGGSSPSGARPRPPRLALTVGGSTQAAEGEQQAERPAARERPPPRPTPAAGRRAPVSALPARPHRRAEGTERGREERRGGRACRRRGQRGDEESRELETCTGGGCPRGALIPAARPPCAAVVTHGASPGPGWLASAARPRFLLRGTCGRLGAPAHRLGSAR